VRVAKPDDDEQEGPTVRKSCTLPAKTVRYLERLGKTGAYGSTRIPGVMTFLIMQGIQDAFAKGVIQPDWDE
jgi:hypothetical protein